MELKACERCGKQTAEGLTLCPDCMKESGAAAEAVAMCRDRKRNTVLVSAAAEAPS